MLFFFFPLPICRTATRFFARFCFVCACGAVGFFFNFRGSQFLRWTISLCSNPFRTKWLATRGARGGFVLQRTHWGSWWCDAPRAPFGRHPKPENCLAYPSKRRGSGGSHLKNERQFSGFWFAASSYKNLRFNLHLNWELSTTLFSSLRRASHVRASEPA